jgi:hypothetical protein
MELGTLELPFLHRQINMFTQDSDSLVLLDQVVSDPRCYFQFQHEPSTAASLVERRMYYRTAKMGSFSSLV